jgi:hypothetical protein
MTHLGERALANWAYHQRRCNRGNFFVSKEGCGYVSNGVCHPPPRVAHVLLSRGYVERYGPKGSYRVTKKGFDWHDRYIMGVDHT